MTSKFDEVAADYDFSLPPLPEEYCQLIQERFSLSEEDKIIDLGCGSGLLTFVLSRFSNHVKGIDISKKMVEIALNRDKKRRIKWICDEVENFNFSYNHYSLIISYESFHLFKSIDDLVKKCIHGLQPGGFLCIGWCCYMWEEPLKDIITEVFKSIGIEWGEWGYQRCADFFTVIERNKRLLSPVVEEKVRVHAKINVRNIALYLGSIEKAATLETSVRKNLIKELEKNIKIILSSDWIDGIASYSLAYSRKYNP